MKFTKLYKQMETNLCNYSPGFQQQVSTGLRIYPRIKDERDLETKKVTLNDQIKNQLLIYCLIKLTSSKKNALNQIDEMLGSLLEENPESLNDHHAAQPVYEKFKQLIENFSFDAS